jgi:hypothetical protein
VGAFDGGLITSDAGALLLGATNKAIRLVDRFAACFGDARNAGQIEHTVATLVGQRVFGLALGYEDLNDHDELRHDPVFAVLAGKLEARRRRCAPVAGKSTLMAGGWGKRSRRCQNPTPSTTARFRGCGPPSEASIRCAVRARRQSLTLYPQQQTESLQCGSGRLGAISGHS